MDFGCSSFSWETTDGLHLLGRTYDQSGSLKNNSILAVPREYPLPLMPDAPQAVPCKYAFVGMAALDFGSPIFVDGINECGLAAALLNFPGYAAYPQFPDRSLIYPGFLPRHLLGHCSTVQDAAEALESLCLADLGIEGHAMSVHYILSDLSGETVIIEPGPSGPRIHRQTIGVLTNSPDYLWQRENLRNYVGITAAPQTSQTIVNHEISCFGAHSGIGDTLPGGYSSPARFARLAFTKAYAPKVIGELEGVTAMFRCFSVVDTPPGLMDSPEDPFQTLCTSVMCLESRMYYFSPSTNRRISAIRLQDLRNNTVLRHFKIPQTQDIAYLN